MTRLLVALALAWSLLLAGIIGTPGAAAQGPVALTIDPRTLAASAPAAFLAGETVGLWYTRPDGTATDFGTTVALADGRLGWALDPAVFVAIPVDAVNLVARGWLSGQQAVHTFPGAGTWQNTAPCVDRPGSPDADGVSVCDGTSTWQGPLLEGTTTYALTYTVDAAGVLAGTLDETFTGTAADGVRGTIHFVETISLTPTGPDTARVYVAATATGGTGGFCHVTGRLAFGGVDSLATGHGDGPFLGHLALPEPCR